MNRLYKLLIFSFLLIASAFNMEKDLSGNSKSGQIFEVKCGNVAMKISSEGGRIISYRFGEKEFITNQNEHENYGSTLWTSPQSDWGWPPYSILDSVEYSTEKIAGVLKMTSKEDPKSGFQIEKSWQTDDVRSIRIKYLIRNISGKDKAVGPWEVTRVPCGGLAFFPNGGKANIPDSDLKPDLQKDGINWILIDKEPISENLKLFSTAQEGWLAYELNGILFIKQFPDILPENYSPQQGEVEIYVNKEKSYIELENHGAYRLLKPDESLNYMVSWYLVPIPRTVKIEAGSPQLILFARQQINRINSKEL